MAHTSISTTSWISLPVARKKTDAIHSIATIPGLDAQGYLVATTRRLLGSAYVAARCATRSGPSLGFDELLGLAASARQAAAVSSSRRGSRASDHRSMTAMPVADGTTCPSTPPAPSSFAPCSKASPTTAAGCSTRSSASRTSPRSASHLRRRGAIGPVVPDLRRRARRHDRARR